MRVSTKSIMCDADVDRSLQIARSMRRSIQRAYIAIIIPRRPVRVAERIGQSGMVTLLLKIRASAATLISATGAELLPGNSRGDFRRIK